MTQVYTYQSQVIMGQFTPEKSRKDDTGEKKK